MHITMLKKPIWKGYILYDSNYIIFKKRQNYEDRKDQWLSEIRGGEGRDEWAEHRGFLVQWKYSVQYYNRVHMSYICPNP